MLDCCFSSLHFTILCLNIFLYIYPFDLLKDPKHTSTPSRKPSQKKRPSYKIVKKKPNRNLTRPTRASWHNHATFLHTKKKSSRDLAWPPRALKHNRATPFPLILACATLARMCFACFHHSLSFHLINYYQPWSIK